MPAPILVTPKLLPLTMPLNVSVPPLATLALTLAPRTIGPVKELTPEVLFAPMVDAPPPALMLIWLVLVRAPVDEAIPR